MGSSTSTSTSTSTSGRPGIALGTRRGTGIRGGEAFFWGLFGAGGAVAALFVPIHILLNSIAAPLGCTGPAEAISYDRMLALVRHPIARLYFGVIIALPLFTFAHRFRHLFHERGIHIPEALAAVLFYGAAIAGTVATAVVLARL